MKVGAYIKHLRTQKGLTQEELGELLGVKKAAVQKWESGSVQNLKRETIKRLADIFEVSPAKFVTDDEVKPSSELVPVAGNIYQIPVFESVSAGFGAYADSNVVEYIPLVLSSPFEAKVTIAAKVKGDSMYPKIEDGDLVVIRKQDAVENGDIAVVLIDGDESYVKKIAFGQNYVELISINPEYMPKRFEGEDINRIRVVGKVMGSYKKF